MRALCIVLSALGAGVMLVGIVCYREVLLKVGWWLALRVVFVLGCVAALVSYCVGEAIAIGDVIVSGTLFLGSACALVAAAIFSRERQEKERAHTTMREENAFLAKVSHELRTPMNAVLGMAELAQRAEDLQAACEHIATIRRAGEYLLALVDDILDFAKVENGILEPFPVDYSFSALMNDVTNIVRMRAMDSQLRCAVNTDSRIPDALYGDEKKIRQVLINVLGNAIKYTDRGFVSLDVEGRIQGDEVILTMRVADSGMGIREEDMDKLFAEFVRLDPANRRTMEGVGLGLSITQSILTGMGGVIDVRSEYGKGSVFTVTLPQKIRSFRPQAKVEHPEEKRAVIYERRTVHAQSLARIIANLGVECMIVETDQQFRAALGGCGYVFIAGAIYERNIDVLREVAPEAKVILIAEFGQTIPYSGFASISMPVQTVAVADLLGSVRHSAPSRVTALPVNGFTASEVNILVVDDVATNLKVAKGLLAPYRARVDLCRNGADALQAVRYTRYDLILMDHLMPGMDGAEAALAIRALGRDVPYCRMVPIIAVTANAVSDAREMLLANGFDDFLLKPVTTAQLNEILEKWIPMERRDAVS